MDLLNRQGNEDQVSNPRVVAFLTDMIFMTKIVSTGKALNVPVKSVRDTASLESAIDAEETWLVIVDLNADGGTEAVVSAVGAAGEFRVVGFVSHVDKALADAARLAGADEVLPRSAFVVELPSLLSGVGPAGE